MSDNSSNSSNDNNTDFKTDYMVDIIANSDKLKPEESRIKFDKNKEHNVIHQIQDSVVETDDDYFDEKSNNNNFINNNTFKEKPTNQTNNYSKNNYSRGRSKISEYEDEFEKSDRYKSDEFCDDDEYDDYNSLSEYKKKQRKLVLLGELGDLAKNRGIKLTKPYSINSDYYEMKHELEFHRKIINKTSAVSWMSGLLLTSVEGIELLSDNYGANYGVNIHGWSRRMDSNRKDIYEILGDLYIKYNKQGSDYSPEIRLVFILLSSLLGTQLGNMNKETDIQKTKNGVNANSDIEIMREKAKQETMYGNTVMQDTINKEHDNAFNEMKNFRDLKDIHNQNIQENNRLNEMDNIQKRYMENNIHSENTENNRTIDIKNQLKNLRSDINNSLDLELENDKSETSSSSKNKSSKNKSMYSKKSFKKGKGIVIKSK